MVCGVVLHSTFLTSIYAELMGGNKMRPPFTFGRLAAFAVSIMLASLQLAMAEDSLADTRKTLVSGKD